MDLRLDTMGPHSDDYTRRLADGVAETVRVLNYATRPGERGLTQPGTVGDVLGALSAGAYGLPQLLGQLGDALRSMGTAGPLRAVQPHDVHTTILAVAAEIADARDAATALAGALRRAQNAAAALYFADLTGQGGGAE